MPAGLRHGEGDAEVGAGIVSCHLCRVPSIVWQCPSHIDPIPSAGPRTTSVPASLSQAREWAEVTTLLLAIEVLSPSSRTRDRVIKRRLLQRVAVPEYWVVDLSRRLVERWRPDDRHAEVVASSLVWHPPGPNEPLTIDLVSLFAVVCG